MMYDYDDEERQPIPIALIQALREAIDAKEIGTQWWTPEDGVEVAHAAHGVRVGGHLPTVDELRRTPEPDRWGRYYSRVLDAYGLRVGGRGRWLVH